MLATQLRREIREIEEIRNVSVFELNELAITDRDFIISTIHLQGFSREYITVSPFLTAQEIQQVQLYARRKMLLKKSSPLLEKKDSSTMAIANRMDQIHMYTGAIAHLLRGFRQTTINEVASLETYIHEICQQLEKEQVIGNANDVAEALFARLALGGVGIPETKLALLHTKHKDVKKPSFTIQSLREPMLMKAMDGTQIEVSHLLVLLSPEPYHDSGLEVLSFISTYY